MKNFDEYYKNLPTKVIATGILIPYQDTLLAVKPSYKEAWSIPGGVVEANESPFQGAIREAKEEIGVDVNIVRLLAIDHTLQDSLQFIFLAKELDKQLINSIRIDMNEIIDYKFISKDFFSEILTPNLKKRIQTILEVNDFSKTLYLDNGKLIFS